MIRPIVKFPKASLRAPCREVSFPLTPALSEHIRDLKDTLAATPHGVALASNQLLTEGHRVFVVLPGFDLPEVVINPVWDPVGGETTSQTEGCLSIPELNLSFPRAAEVYLRYRGESGDDYAYAVKGFTARIVQHECDHLSGKLLLDYADKKTQILIRAEAIKNRKRGK